MADETNRLAAIAARQDTVAGKIRALAAEGLPRADIARFLGKRYQHVRNVLEADAQSASYVLGKVDLSGVQESASSFEGDEAYIDRRLPCAMWLRVRPDGSLVLPDDVREALNAHPGEKVFGDFEGGVLRLMSGDAAEEEARTIVCRYIPAHVNLADSLIADRRAEAARQHSDDV
jgi:hypothetical protein